jgi:DNA-3-methyladenine glycosylase II
MKKNGTLGSAKRHLKTRDKVLAKIIAKVDLKERKSHKRYFESLCVAIINQQLSGKAAATIEKRFVSLFSGAKFPSPRQVLRKPDALLRSAGLSFQKIGYIKSLARLVGRKKISFNKFNKMADEDIIGQLIKVKGIGRWTAEMFLMFCLNRPDVFSHGDLGLKNAIKKWYKLDKDRQPKKYHRLVESWKPHRTAAARYLWASQELR